MTLLRHTEKIKQDTLKLVWVDTAVSLRKLSLKLTLKSEEEFVMLQANRWKQRVKHGPLP